MSSEAANPDTQTLLPHANKEWKSNVNAKRGTSSINRYAPAERLVKELDRDTKTDDPT